MYLKLIVKHMGKILLNLLVLTLKIKNYLVKTSKEQDISNISYVYLKVVNFILKLLSNLYINIVDRLF